MRLAALFVLTVRVNVFDFLRCCPVVSSRQKRASKTGFYTPYWEMLADYSYDEYGNKVLTKDELLSAQVFDLTRPISSDINTDIGSLKSTLLTSS